MSKTPTDEQAKAIECQGNTVITARPGSGKTFTISQKIAVESQTLLSYQGIIAISYTRKASDELKTRCERLGTKRNSSFFGTIDSFCLHEIVSPFLSRYNGEKTVLEITDEDTHANKFTRSGVTDLAKKGLVTGAISIGLLCDAALEVIKNVAAARRYLKARYVSVYIDEYQDCGAAQHELVMLLGHMGLRVVAVGDLDQAIYGWAGKSSIYLQKLIQDASFCHFQLTRNYRCHPSIVAYSLRLLGDRAANIVDGDKRVIQIELKGDEAAIAHMIALYVPRLQKKYGITDAREIAVIARSGATLDRTSRALQIPYRMYARSPLDKGFSKWKRLLGKLLEVYYSDSRYFADFMDAYFTSESNLRTRTQCITLVQRFLEQPENELQVNKDLAFQIAELCERGMGTIEDKTAYSDSVKDLDLLHASYKQPRNNEISLMTYHKSKGLEFDAVFCLEAYQWIMPPQWDRDKNYNTYQESLAMHYVGITRARKVCLLPLASGRHNKYETYYDTVPSEFLQLNGVQNLRINAKPAELN